MSSKTQLSGYVKRLKLANRELSNTVSTLKSENLKLRQLNHQLKNQLSYLPKNHRLKKWWQFWK